MPKPMIQLVKLLAVLLVVYLVFVLFIQDDRVVLPPGVQAAEEPVQEAMEPIVVYEDDDYSVTAFATFRLEAKVLARERYRNDREADLSPIDLALGWRRMSDQKVVDEIKISQRGRWYEWRTKGALPIPQRDIEQCSANMHLLPKNDRVRKAMLAVRTGEIISLDGYLVNVSAPDGWSWQSSATRSDTGSGACEVIWVESFEVIRSE